MIVLVAFLATGLGTVMLLWPGATRRVVARAHPRIDVSGRWFRLGVPAALILAGLEGLWLSLVHL